MQYVCVEKQIAIGKNELYAAAYSAASADVLPSRASHGTYRPTTAPGGHTDRLFHQLRAWLPEATTCP